MQEVVEGLTRPLDEADLGPLEFDRSTPRLVAPDTAENLERLFLERHWTDGLPIVLPTEERVAAMAVVNGPVRHEIGMNAGTGALGPYSHANATIGRA
jgi:hypothetical protein